jgi:hypothetical protein
MEHMKTFAVVTATLAFTTVVLAQSAPPGSTGLRIDLDKPAQPATPAPKKDDKKMGDAKKKEEPPAKIEGIEIARGTGFMGIQLVGGTFKLSFYDAKKKPVAPDVTRASLSWKVRYQSLPERTVLNPDGNALTSAKVVKPPYSFSLAITLIKGDGDAAATENFAVDFHP